MAIKITDLPAAPDGKFRTEDEFPVTRPSNPGTDGAYKQSIANRLGDESIEGNLTITGAQTVNGNQTVTGTSYTNALDIDSGNGTITSVNNNPVFSNSAGAQVTLEGDTTTIHNQLHVEATPGQASSVSFRHVDGGAGVDASITSKASDNSFEINNAQLAPIKGVINGVTNFEADYDGTDSTFTVNGKVVADSLKVNTGAAAGKVLKSDANGNATWQDDSTGSGDVVGPASSTNLNISIFTDGSGKNIGDSGYSFSELAFLASPAFTGNPTAPTQSSGDNSTKIATTAYVDAQVSPSNKGVFATAAALRSAYPTGQNGWYAVVTATDTFWLWDGDSSDWANSDTNAGGDVNGPSSSVNGEISAFSGPTGKIVMGTGVQASQVTTNMGNIAANTVNISTNATAIATKISATSTDTLENKTIDASNNTLVLNTQNLTDVSNSSPTAGQVLKFDGTQYAPADDSTGGDVVGPASSTATHAAIYSDNSGKSLSNGPALLALASKDTVSTAEIDALAVTDAKVATGIDAAKIGDGSVSNTELAYLNSVTSSVQTQLDAKLTSSSPLSSLSNVSSTAPSNNEVLKYNSTSNEWEPAADSTGGTVTSVGITAGTGISSSGSPVTSSGSISVALDSATQTTLAQVSTNTSDIAGKISASSTDTLTNKTIDVASNTVSNIEVSNLKATAVVTESEGIGSNDNDTSLPTSAAVKDYVDNNSGSGSVTSVAVSSTDITVSGSPITSSGTIDLSISGLDASKIADGSVSNTEFQYIGNLSSDAQTQLDAKSTASKTETLTNKTISSATNTLSIPTTALSDVSTTAPSNGQVLKYDSSTSKYVPSADNAGSGDIVGPSSSVDSEVVAFDGTTGKLVKGTGKSYDDIGRVILQRFTTTGTGNFTAPSGAIAAHITAYGGAGGGAGGGYSFFDGTIDSYVGGAGGGGASGAKAEIYLNVSGGSTQFYYNIGSGGTAGSGQTVGVGAGSGGVGSITTVGIDSTLLRTLIRASGGLGGQAPTGTGSGALPDGGHGAGGMTDFGGGGGARGLDGASNGNFGYGGLGTVMAGGDASGSVGGPGGFQATNSNKGGSGGGAHFGAGGSNGSVGSAGSLASGGGGGSGGNSSGTLANGLSGGNGGDGFISVEWQY